jgi:hypothetical protein
MFDIDGLGHVNDVAYLRWVQDVAVAHWKAIASISDQAKLWWGVVRHEIDYNHPAYFGQRDRRQNVGRDRQPDSASNHKRNRYEPAIAASWRRPALSGAPSTPPLASPPALAPTCVPASLCRKMPLVAGHHVIGAGGIGALQELVVVRVLCRLERVRRLDGM